VKRERKKRFLNKKELSEYLGISVYTLDSWVSQRREIPYIKVGTRVLFDIEDVHAWLESRKVFPREEPARL
jgi:excisionase family DNA binding protein